MPLLPERVRDYTTLAVVTDDGKGNPRYAFYREADRAFTRALHVRFELARECQSVGADGVLRRGLIDQGKCPARLRFEISGDVLSIGIDRHALRIDGTGLSRHPNDRTAARQNRRRIRPPGQGSAPPVVRAPFGLPRR